MKADVIAFEAEGFVSKLIAYITKSKISHVGIVVGVTFMMESKSIGVKLTDLSRDTRKYHILRHLELTEEQKQSISNFVMHKVDMKYDFKLLIGIGLKKVFRINNSWNDTRRYICSELVIDAYKSIGIALIDSSDLYDITPANIVKSNKLVEMSSL